MAGTGPLKRVSVFCRDAERSLRLYRDILGLQVIEDKVLHGPAVAKLVGLMDCRLRIVHLSTGDTDHAWVGLYEVSRAEPMPPAITVPRGDRITYGQAAMVFETTQMKETVARLKRAGHVFMTEPTTYTKAADAGGASGGPTPPGTYTEALFFDPDGVPVALIAYDPP